MLILKIPVSHALMNYCNFLNFAVKVWSYGKESSFCVFVCSTGKSDFEESIHKEKNRWGLFFSEEK